MVVQIMFSVMRTIVTELHMYVFIWSRNVSLVLSHAHHYITSSGVDAGRNSDEVNHLYGVAADHFGGRGVSSLTVLVIMC